MVYDVIIIGGGPGGCQAAADAADAGLTVALVEEKRLGGTCLNEGCIPAKTLLYSSGLLHKAKEAASYGIVADNPQIRPQSVVERKNTIVSQLQKGLTAKLRHKKIDIFYETAIVKTVEKEIQVSLCNKSCICGRHLILASGSRTFIPDIKGLEEALEEGFAMDSRKFLDNTTLYKKVIVIGCGIIGIEFASFLASIGTEVILLDNRKEILEEMDEDVKNILVRSLQMKGIKFRLGVKVLKVDAGKKSALIQDEEEEELLCDEIIVCAGRIPNLDAIEDANTGIRTQNGAIITDDFGRTNKERVYAVGDVNGRIMLAHTAYAEAGAAVQHILGNRQAVEYHLIPKVIYSNPEAAWVGITEKEYENKKSEYDIKVCSMKYSGRFMIENQKEQGICKLISEKKSGRIMGGFLVGDGAAEIIIVIENMIKDKKTISDIRQMIFPHPSIGEVIRECAYME